MARREIWRHIETGDFYVVEVENSELIGAGGPFSRRTLKAVMRDGLKSDPDLLSSLLGGYTGFRRLDWYENMLLQKPATLATI